VTSRSARSEQAPRHPRRLEARHAARRPAEEVGRRMGRLCRRFIPAKPGSAFARRPGAGRRGAGRRAASRDGAPRGTVRPQLEPLHEAAAAAAGGVGRQLDRHDEVAEDVAAAGRERIVDRRAHDEVGLPELPVGRELRRRRAPARGSPAGAPSSAQRASVAISASPRWRSFLKTPNRDREPRRHVPLAGRARDLARVVARVRVREQAEGRDLPRTMARDAAGVEQRRDVAGPVDLLREHEEESEPRHRREHIGPRRRARRLTAPARAAARAARRASSTSGSARALRA
jgi:hypothetical protein